MDVQTSPRPTIAEFAERMALLAEKLLADFDGSTAWEAGKRSAFRKMARELRDPVNRGPHLDCDRCGGADFLYSPESPCRKCNYNPKPDCDKALQYLSGAGICTPEKTYGTDVHWAVHDLCRALSRLSAFKKYVHQRLDEAGIPEDPPSVHQAHGCRIGGRLDLVLNGGLYLTEEIWGIETKRHRYRRRPDQTESDFVNFVVERMKNSQPNEIRWGKTGDVIADDLVDITFKLPGAIVAAIEKGAVTFAERRAPEVPERKTVPFHYQNEIDGGESKWAAKCPNYDNGNHVFSAATGNCILCGERPLNS